MGGREEGGTVKASGGRDLSHGGTGRTEKKWGVVAAAPRDAGRERLAVGAETENEREGEEQRLFSNFARLGIDEWRWRWY